MKKSTWKSVVLVMALIAVVGVSSGCKKKKTQGLNPGLNQTTATPRNEPTGGDGLPQIDQENILWGSAGLQVIYFDYNSSALRSDATATLRANADKIKAVPGEIIQIEGHCDERGSQEYNLALGERRALSVREFLINLGVSGDRLLTISYGEENPAEMGSNESAWARNRRAEFNKAME